jgi:excisionase family DNA binding protein
MTNNKFIRSDIMLWNVKQVANYLSISDSMVYKMVSRRELPFLKLGDCIRFIPETIESFINRNQETVNPEVKTPPGVNTDMNLNSQFFGKYM